jgi:hypothetical protein
LGIALAHFPIKGPYFNRDYYPFVLGYAHLDLDAKRYPYVSDPDAKAVFRSIWTKLNQLDQKSLNDVILMKKFPKGDYIFFKDNRCTSCQEMEFVGRGRQNAKWLQSDNVHCDDSRSPGCAHLVPSIRAHFLERKGGHNCQQCMNINLIKLMENIKH